MGSYKTQYGQPGRYNASLPTLPDGAGSALAVDENGKLLVSVSLAANSSVNVNQVGGTAVDTNSGNKSAGTLRVVIATDQPNFTTPLNTNVAQMNGVTVTMGNGASGTGVQRVTLASDSTGNIATIGTSVTPGTAAANLGKAVDGVAGATDTGVAALVVRDDALSTLTPVDGDYTVIRTDSTGATWVRETLAPAYEDNTNSKAIVEHRYTSSGVLAADTLVKTGAGLLHTITFSCNDAAPTAGSLILYDNTAESGTQIFNHTFTTTPFAPCSVTLDVTFATGLYAGFTTTADVNVVISYR